MRNGGRNVALRDLGTLFEVGSLGGLSDGQLLDRFVARREEAVFEAIVRRHGPMVWGVCRRVLRDHHDAEDAFQATFLVLARKATLVMPREKLGNWLYGVAYQTAMKARAVRARRRGRESHVSDLPEPTVVLLDLRDALAESLDRELSRLPETYRIPIVLCDLEGKTHREAARQLGWPIGTVSSRLSRARAMLARRLSRQGVSLPAGSLAILLAQDAASASMPTRLIGPMAQAASLFAAGGAATAGMVSAGVAALTGEVMTMMVLSKIKVATVFLAASALTAGGTDLIYRAQAESQRSDKQSREAPLTGLQAPPLIAQATERNQKDLQQLSDLEKINALQQIISEKKEEHRRLINKSAREQQRLIDESAAELQRLIDEQVALERLIDKQKGEGQVQMPIHDPKPTEEVLRTEGEARQRLEQRVETIEKKLDLILKELRSKTDQPSGLGRGASNDDEWSRFWGTDRAIQAENQTPWKTHGGVGMNGMDQGSRVR